MQKRGKKAALELSVGTIVVIVLAMTMLILGLVLVRSIFSGAKYNIDTINDKVRGEIDKLFVEDKKTVIYLANQKATIKQGEDWGVAFGIKNLRTGTPEAGEFKYIVEVSDPKVKQKCGITEDAANLWITTGGEDTINIPSGDAYYGITRFKMSETAPLCILRYHLEVDIEGVAYATDFFDLEIKAK